MIEGRFDGIYWFARSMMRRASAWAWNKEVETINGFTRIKELGLKPGEMKLEVEQHPEMAQWMAHCFASLVASSPNYSEMKFDLKKQGDNDEEWLTILIKKGKGRTPHQLREVAEEEVKKLKQEIEEMRSNQL